MATVNETIEVGVPVRAAYDQWTQFEDFPRFMEEVREVRQIDDTHLVWVTEIDGTQAESDAEIVEQEPDRRIAWRSTGDVRYDGTVELEALGDSLTRVRVTLADDADDDADRVDGATGLAQRRVRRNMERFKDLLELRGESSGTRRGEIRGPGSERPGAPRPPAGREGASDGGATRLSSLSSIRGMTVRNGAEKIGRVREVYLDGRAERVRYLGVSTGWLARGIHVIPIDEITFRDAGGEAEIVVPYSTDHIKDAPTLDDDDELTPERESQISDHYAEAEEAEAAREAVRARQTTPAPTPQIAEATVRDAIDSGNAAAADPARNPGA